MISANGDQIYAMAAHDTAERLVRIETMVQEIMRRLSVWDDAAMADTITTEEAIAREDSSQAIMKAIREAAR